MFWAPVDAPEKRHREIPSLCARLQLIQKPLEAPDSLNWNSLLPGDLGKILMRKYFDGWHSTISGDHV